MRRLLCRKGFGHGVVYPSLVQRAVDSEGDLFDVFVSYWCN